MCEPAEPRSGVKSASVANTKNTAEVVSATDFLPMAQDRAHRGCTGSSQKIARLGKNPK